MTLSELMQRLHTVKERHGDLPVLYPIHDDKEHRFLFVEDAGVVHCVADSQGMKRAHLEDGALPCVVIYG